MIALLNVSCEMALLSNTKLPNVVTLFGITKVVSALPSKARVSISRKVLGNVTDIKLLFLKALSDTDVTV